MTEYSHHHMDCFINDLKSPIVILFGHPYSGRTVALIRLAKYLRGQGYSVFPDTSFRFKDDSFYDELCDEYTERFIRYETPPGNSSSSYILSRVLLYGKTVCQILDMPGEHSFDTHNPFKKISFPFYLRKIIDFPNKKIWTFFVNLCDLICSQTNKDAYSATIQKIRDYISPNDKVIFVINKVDLYPQLFDHDKLSKTFILKQIRNEFPDLFARYKNSGFKRLLYGRYDFELVFFQQGHSTV